MENQFQYEIHLIYCFAHFLELTNQSLLFFPRISINVIGDKTTFNWHFENCSLSIFEVLRTKKSCQELFAPVRFYKRYEGNLLNVPKRNQDVFFSEIFSWNNGRYERQIWTELLATKSSFNKIKADTTPRLETGAHRILPRCNLLEGFSFSFLAHFYRIATVSGKIKEMTRMAQTREKEIYMPVSFHSELTDVIMVSKADRRPLTQTPDHAYLGDQKRTGRVSSSD